MSNTDKPKDTPKKIKKDTTASSSHAFELRIFPPHMHLFLLAVLLMMIAHGISAFVILQMHFNVHVNIFVLSNMLSGLAIFIPNILLTRGFSLARKVLIGLSGFYLLTGLSALLVGKEGLIWGGVILLSAITAMLIMLSNKYKILTMFYNERWHRYRETGKPLIDVYKKIGRL